MEHAVRILYFPLAGESLFYETVWEPLSSRRHSKKLTTMYKIHNNFVPDYLKQTFPMTWGSFSIYNTRNTSDNSIPKGKDCKFLRNLKICSRCD